MQSTKIYQWLVDELVTRESVSRRDITDALGDQAERAQLFLEYMVSREIVSSRRHGDSIEYTLEDSDALEAAVREIVDGPRSVGTSEDDVSLHDSLVVNVPADMLEGLDRIRQEYESFEVRDLRSTIADVLSIADEEVLLAVPFLEQSGVNMFLEEFIGLAEGGVSVRLLTRDVLDPSGTGYGHAKKLRAISKLVDLYEAHRGSPDGGIFIRDFSTPLVNQGGTSVQYRSVHQKIVLADRSAAYVGSGEVRENAFLTNGEAGYIRTNQDEVLFWRDFFDLFWNDAREVPSSILSSDSRGASD